MASQGRHILAQGKRVAKKPKKSIGSRLLRVLLIVVFIISATIVAGYCYLTFGVHVPEVDTPMIPTLENEEQSTFYEKVAKVEGLARREQVYTCLIFGEDAVSGCTDTIMVATFDVPNQKIGLVSVPRDTIVRQDLGPASNKVNAAYSKGGVDQLRQEVQELLGIPVDYYVKIKLSAFKKLVDAVGGVWFDVPINMNYDDPVQNLHIHLNKGYQLLNGEQAMQMVRYRQSNSGNGSFGDTGRAGVQQDFLKAMLSQVLSGANITSIPGLVDVLFNHVETNAATNDVIFFARSLLGMDIDTAISNATLPAQWHTPYMWVQEDEALTVINELLNPYNMEVTSEMIEVFKR